MSRADGELSRLPTPLSPVHPKLYEAVIRISRASLRAPTREILCLEVCRAAVESGGFLLAWIGWHDHEQNSIVPAAQFGDDGRYLDGLTIYTDTSSRPEAQGPGGIAFRSGVPYICNDFFADPATCLWRVEAARVGIRACAALPIKVQDTTAGILTVYAAYTGYFQPSEIALLQEAALDVACALDKFALNDERREAEESVRRMAAIIESTSDAVIGTTGAGLITSWNPAAAEMFGYTAAEAVGNNVTMLMPSDQVSEQWEILTRIERNERITGFPTIRLRKDGQRFPAAITVSPIRSPDGRSIGASQVVRDITAVKHAEGALRDAQLQFDLVVENLDEWVAIYDMAGNLLRSNTAAVTLLKLHSAQDIPKNLDASFELYEAISLDGKVLPKSERPIARVIGGEVLRDFEIRVRRVDIPWQRILSYSGTRVQDHRGRTLAFLTIKDITARKEVEQALRRSENRLQHAQRMARICSWDFDLASGLLSWSDGSTEIYGVDMRERGRTMADILALAHPCDRARMEAAQEATANGGPGLNLEHRVVLPNGAIKWVQVIGEAACDADGRPIEINGAVLDITQQRETELALRDANAFLERRVHERTQQLAVARDRAESADRLKSAFLATMSHELRTPLNSIIGFTGIVLQGLAGPLTAEQNKQLGMVRGSARHLLSLINDILDISKIEAGQLEVHAIPFDLAGSVQKMAASLMPMAEQKAVSLRIDASSVLGTMVSDQRRVEQVLLNLLNNAIKFTQQGAVELSVECLESHRLPYHSAAQPCVRFRVTDTGIGIKEDDLPSLFQPFRQIDTGLTRQHEGTGLGLAICSRLTDLLRGELTVESRFGIGSTFIFTIPRFAVSDEP